MPIGGETIGTAYVRILADGSGLDRSIRDQMDDVDWDKNTRKTTSELADKFKENMERDVNQRKLREAISDPLARGDWLSTTFFRSRNWTNFRSGLEKEYGAAGKRAGESLERGLLEGTLSHKGLTGQLENLMPLITKMQREINKEQAAAAALAKKLGRDTADGSQEAADALKKQVAEMKNLRREFTDLNLKVADFAKGFNTLEGRDRPQLLDNLADIERRFRAAGIADFEFERKVRDTRREINYAHPVLARFTHGINEFGDGIGRAFGKGARNDFVNIIGVMAGGVAKIPLIFTGAAKAVMDWVTAMRTAETPLQAFGAFVKPLGMVAGGIAGAFGLLGPLISGLSLLGGVIVAISSTVLMGLAGSVAAVAGAIAPLGVAIGATMLAFTSKRGQAAIKNVKNDLKALGEVAGKELFPDPARTSRKFSQFISSFGPLVKVAARATHDMFGEWEKGTHSRTFGLFKHDLGVFLPVAVRRFGAITSHVFGGLGGVLRALFGLDGQANRMLKWLQRVTLEFDHFVNRHKGQEATEAFFERAGDSARRLGEFIGAAARLIGTLITHGNKAGDGIFGSMTNALNGWNAALKKDGGAGLDKWFADARKFADAIGKVFVGFAKVFDTLDTEFSRMELDLALDAIAGALSTVAAILGPVAKGLGALGSGFTRSAGEAAAAVIIFGKVRKSIIAVQEQALLLQATTATTGGKMMMLGSAARMAAGAGGLFAVVDSTNRASKSMGVLEGAVGGALTGGALGAFGGPVGIGIGAGIGAIAGGLIGLAGSGHKAADGAKAAVSATDALASKMQGYRDTIDETTGAITGMTKARAYDNLFAAGAIQKAQALGISSSLLVKAALGNVKAQEAVRTATDKANAALDGSKWHYDKNGQVVASMTAAQRKAAQGAKDVADAVGLSAEAAHNDVVAMRDRAIALGHTNKILKDIPKQVVTKIKQDGLTKSAADIVSLTKKYHLTPPMVRTILQAANVNPTKAQIDAVTRAAQNLGRQRPRPSVSVGGTASAISEIERVRNSLANMRDRTVRLNIETHAISVRGQHGPATAAGGTFAGAQQRTIAEAGPEAVVPLNRPLGQVDPAVRWLSAIAQGKVPGMASGGVVGAGGRTVNVGGITVVSPQANPKAVAVEAVNRLVGVGY